MKTLTPAAAYIRMSTDQQDASPERQRSEVATLAVSGDYEIVREYEDLGLTGTESANRPQFQQMLKDAAAGKFRAILMCEQSRFSREDLFDVFAHWATLKKAGVKIVTCQRGEMRFDDLGGIITAIVDQHAAHDESLKIAARSVSGKLALLNRGINAVGTRPFAFDREYVDEAGKVVKRVHFRDRFRRPVGWRKRLVPTKDRPTIEAIKWAFDAVISGATLTDVAREFNSRGVTTRSGRRFTCDAVSDVMTSPTLCGDVVVGAARAGKGKFARIAPGAPLVFKDAHPAIIERRKFELAQEAMKKRRRLHSCPLRFPLSGLLFCGYCGSRMSGNTHKTLTGKTRHYGCQVVVGRNESVPCPRPEISAEWIERAVVGLVRRRFLKAENLGDLASAMGALAIEPVGTERDRAILMEVRERLAKATNNLSLADSEADFRAVSATIRRWREDEKEILERIAQTSGAADPEEVEAIAKSRFLEELDRLHEAPADQVSRFLRTIIRRIDFRRRHTPARHWTINFNEAQIALRAELSDGEPARLADHEICPTRKYHLVAEYVRDAGRPVLLGEIQKAMRLSSSSALRQCAVAVAAGLLKNNGRCRGWSAPDATEDAGGLTERERAKDGRENTGGRATQGRRPVARAAARRC
jgi:site-specific DNA recombinase